MNQIGIFNQTGQAVPQLDLVKKVLKKAMKIEHLKNTSFNLILVDDSYIHELNKTYRKIDRVTDVITFALEDDDKCLLPKGKRVLGDIYISIDTAERQAKEYGHGLDRELCFLAVHGVYHLLGYDHMNEKDEKIMFQKQEEVLKEYGLER